jgi:hypothetical protein
LEFVPIGVGPCWLLLAKCLNLTHNCRKGPMQHSVAVLCDPNLVCKRVYGGHVGHGSRRDTMQARNEWVNNREPASKDLRNQPPAIFTDCIEFPRHSLKARMLPIVTIFRIDSFKTE